MDKVVRPCLGVVPTKEPSMLVKDFPLRLKKGRARKGMS